jgi:crossover junction endodeoxyribonuclease RuvC
VSTLILGIDSGLDGAFAWHYGGRILGQLATRQFLDSERRLDFGTIREWCQLVNAKVSDASRAAFIEEPFAPKGRERGVMGSWRRFGQLEALLWTLEYEVIGVQSRRWQSALGIKGDTKAASLAYVREHFPDLNLIPPRARNPHDGLADAVCIAVWGSTQVKETSP